ncbi:MAG: hypothetical protein LBJ15_18860 [Comamonas sp.]|jgi:hypothetical protein|uniref:hypothetical protein n=1 Tax=Comamonas sp. TaxID=34028 RepID=UPI0028309E3A|nr:hypothetical protein [Comamonas sp.]MDR0216036.1 hypothetical protein [Comamonas sp.]
MKLERGLSFLQDMRWRAGLLAFAVLLVVGSGCALWALHELRIDGARAASQDARAMARSVAQTLAQQLGRAARLGIPLQELPGVAPYLAAALERQSTLASIAVVLPDGRTLHAAGSKSAPGDAADTVRVEIAAKKGVAGAVVAVAGGRAAIPQSLARAQMLSAAAVLALAVGAGLWAALGPGAQLERQRRAAWAWLEGTAQADTPRLEILARGGGLQSLLEALAQGDAEQRATQEAVDAYAQELLAMDFDGLMREDIERIVRPVVGQREEG